MGRNSRRATGICSAVVLALLTACSTTPVAEKTPPPTGIAPTPQSSSIPNAPDSSSPNPNPSAADLLEFVTGDIRELKAGVPLAEVTASIRPLFKSFADLSDDEIAIAFNAGCDLIDESGRPEPGALVITNYGVSYEDAAFGLLFAIQAYCPEHSDFLTGG